MTTAAVIPLPRTRTKTPRTKIPKGGAKLVFATRGPRTPLESALGVELRRIETRVTTTEHEGIEARWDFGRALLRQREGKKLPPGLRAAITKELGLQPSEINRRMQLAETFHTHDALMTAVTIHGTWRRIRSEVLPKKTSKPKPASTFEYRMTERITRLTKEARTPEERSILAQILIDASHQMTKEKDTP